MQAEATEQETVDSQRHLASETLWAHASVSHSNSNQILDCVSIIRCNAENLAHDPRWQTVAPAVPDIEHDTTQQKLLSRHTILVSHGCPLPNQGQREPVSPRQSNTVNLSMLAPYLYPKIQTPVAPIRSELYRHWIESLILTASSWREVRVSQPWKVETAPNQTNPFKSRDKALDPSREGETDSDLPIAPRSHQIALPVRSSNTYMSQSVLTNQIWLIDTDSELSSQSRPSLSRFSLGCGFGSNSPAAIRSTLGPVNLFYCEQQKNSPPRKLSRYFTVTEQCTEFIAARSSVAMILANPLSLDTSLESVSERLSRLSGWNDPLGVSRFHPAFPLDESRSFSANPVHASLERGNLVVCTEILRKHSLSPDDLSTTASATEVTLSKRGLSQRATAPTVETGLNVADACTQSTTSHYGFSSSEKPANQPDSLALRRRPRRATNRQHPRRSNDRHMMPPSKASTEERLSRYVPKRSTFSKAA